MKSSYCPLLLILLTGLGCLPARGQDSAEVQRLADQTSERVAKEHPKQVFVETGHACVFDTQLCQTLEADLRAGLTKLVPEIQFVNRERFLQELKNKGFLSIDAEDDSLAREFASEIGAEIVVVENLKIEVHGYELTCYIVRVNGDKEIGSFKTKIYRSGSDSDHKPLLLRDDESGITFPVYRENVTQSPPPYVPHCMTCPDPVYPDAARRKRLQGVVVFFVTINLQGTAEQISLVKSFDPSLTDNAIQTIRAWRFKPAIGPDGKPFISRVPLEITYRLPP